MKFRNGFVTNSSSTAYIITNKTNQEKTLVDFVKENPQLIDEFIKDYNWYTKEEGYNQERMLESAESQVKAFPEESVFPPNTSIRCVFGDEDGSLIGHVFDYILRYGGSSESFEWEFLELLR